MTNRTCTFPDCNRKYKCKGLCSTHYAQRFKGKPLTAVKQTSAPDDVRFWSKVSKGDGCWAWLGGFDTGGYAVARFGRRNQKGHRLALILSGVEIPAGSDVDHMCHNRGCVNPGHLRVATRKQNTENLSGAHRDSSTGVRGVSWNKQRQKYMARVTHNYQVTYLGIFDTIEEAEAAVRAKRLELYTHNDADRVTN